MGAIIAVMMTGIGVFGIYNLFTKPDFRRSLFGEFMASPVVMTFIFALCACMLLFFWGVFVPPLGTIKIMIFGKHRELWAVAGIASLVGFAVMVLYSWLNSPRSK